MSIGGMKRVGKIRFPTIRRSTDILQPESGDVDFSEALKEFDEDKSRSVSETEETTQKLIKDNEEREQPKKQNDKGEEEKEEDEETIHIDIRA
jgi:hypothetical protein